ncbi:iron-containing redox enzyme family protein [Haliangium sp.]|uniref:iron-containing redox enzyme family protein n=1 Tax=Haliangium sp. TaxID=2663208 RepID=UPI003D0B3537
MEWAQVAPGCIVVATSDRAWLHQPVFTGQPDPFAWPMETPGSLATTRQLLDGAIAAAGRHQPPNAPARPALTPLRWVFRLAGYYRTTHATPRLMAAAAERFAGSGRTALADWALAKVREETGHDRLALRDLTAMGYDAEGVVEALIPSTAQALVEYFEARVVHDPDPIGCVGYAYALERLALGRGARDIAAVDALMPAGVTATRCLRVHSAAGSDAAHVEETVALVAGLGAEERADVARACYETASIFCRPPAGGFVPDDTLARTLSAFELQAESRRDTP